MIQLVNGKKKRPFSAVSTTPCELAIMSRIAYNRIVKKQLQVLAKGWFDALFAVKVGPVPCSLSAILCHVACQQSCAV